MIRIIAVSLVVVFGFVTSASGQNNPPAPPSQNQSGDDLLAALLAAGLSATLIALILSKQHKHPPVSP